MGERTATSYDGDRPYLPSDDPETVHIISLGRGFWTTVARKSAGAGPTLRRPCCIMGEDGRIAEAGDVSNTVFVNYDVCLGDEVMVSCV